MQVLAPPDLQSIDLVINNTNPLLSGSDTFGDSETSIAINPIDPNEIVITAFSGSFPTAPLWHSTDGGSSWTKRFSIPAPPGIPLSGPNDQTIDFGQDGSLFGAILVGSSGVFTGVTTNPDTPTAWQWRTIAGVTQRTNVNSVTTSVDQPWLLVNPAPDDPTVDNVYVAYSDFNGPSGTTMRVAVSQGSEPPNFTIDTQSGLANPLASNPGHRLAGDRATGAVYSLFQQSTASVPPGLKTVTYRLNRSTDGGLTWGLNGSRLGITVATRQSNQAPNFKFGTVNALLGGVLHASVDPTTGDLYYVFGDRDPDTGNNRLGIVRIQFSPAGMAVVGPESFVTGQVQAALPSIAVNQSGTIGVMYTTFDGFDPFHPPGIPVFTQHLAISGDQGVTFLDTPLTTFYSPSPDNGDPRQRVLGDYQQLKVVGPRFYGSFTANGIRFGRPFENFDPFFFTALPAP